MGRSEGVEAALGGLVVDAGEPVEMEFFGLEPSFERFAGVGFEFDKHLTAVHSHEDPEGFYRSGSVEASGKFFGALASQTGHGVLREIARHDSGAVPSSEFS
jgi:hypothetical protein